jgi:hypothetical protein
MAVAVALALVACGDDGPVGSANGAARVVAAGSTRGRNAGVYDTWGPLFRNERRLGNAVIRAELYVRIERESVTAIGRCDAQVSGVRYRVEATGTGKARVVDGEVELHEDIVVASPASEGEREGLRCRGTLERGTLSFELLPDGRARLHRAGETILVGRRR